MSGHLECRGLVGGYGKIVAFRDVDLDIRPGQVLAVLGPNGAGKTTLMMTLAGLLPRIAGEVLLEGAVLPSGVSCDEKGCRLGNLDIRRDNGRAGRCSHKRSELE